MIAIKKGDVKKENGKFFVCTECSGVVRRGWHKSASQLHSWTEISEQEFNKKVAAGARDRTPQQ